MNTPKKSKKKAGVPAHQLKHGAKIILTPDELLKIFPEPETCIAEIEAAIDEGLKIVKNEEHKKKFSQEVVLPEILESEIAVENIKWYLNQIGQIPKLTEPEEKGLARQVRQGDLRAREKMINANLRLVVYLAKNFKNKGLAFLDLIQAGNFGLIKAVDKFNPDKELKFGIFAIPLIKEAIWKAVRKQGYLIKMPRDQAAKVRMVQKVRFDLIQEKGRWPTAAEVASLCGLDMLEVEKIFKLDQILISLDKEVGEEGRRLIDQLKSEAEFDEERRQGISGHVNLDGLIDKLAEKEREIICLHYGLKGAQALSQEEISKLLGVKKETIIKIENEAIEKMKEFLDNEETI